MTKRWFSFLFIVALLVTVTVPASALTFWYGGDADHVNGLLSESGGLFGSAMTYDDFTATTPGWNVYSILGNFYMNTNATNAYYEIRSGMSEGNGGILNASGTIDVTQTFTLESDPQSTVPDIYTIAGNTPSILLAPGTYWIGIAPIIDSNGLAYVTTTKGTGGFGSPLDNGNSFFNWSTNGYNFTSTANAGLGSDSDFSYGVFANPAAVPEPASMLALGIGLIGLVPIIRRKK